MSRQYKFCWEDWKELSFEHSHANKTWIIRGINPDFEASDRAIYVESFLKESGQMEDFLDAISEHEIAATVAPTGMPRNNVLLPWEIATVISLEFGRDNDDHRTDRWTVRYRMMGANHDSYYTWLEDSKPLAWSKVAGKDLAKRGFDPLLAFNEWSVGRCKTLALQSVPEGKMRITFTTPEMEMAELALLYCLGDEEVKLQVFADRLGIAAAQRAESKLVKAIKADRVKMAKRKGEKISQEPEPPLDVPF